MKKILCLLLAISLAVSVAVIAPVTASAAETEQPTAASGREEKVPYDAELGFSDEAPDASQFPVSGTYGDCTWVVDLDGTMTISGTGWYYRERDKSDFYAEPWRLDFVKKIIIEDGITGIGDRALRDYINLTSLSLPDSLKKVDEYAFCDCDSLKSVTIPDNVSSIGQYAFGYYINDFWEYSAVDGFTIYGYTGSAAEYYAKGNGFDFVSLGESKNPMFPMTGKEGDCEWTLTEDGVLTITGSGEWSYFNLEIRDIVKEVVIGEGITAVGSDAFMFCKKLERVTIKGKIPEINDYTFCNCVNLKSITLPDSVESIGYRAFEGCKELKSITLPEGLKSIGWFAFLSSGLTSIVIPDSVNTIVDNAIGYFENQDEDWRMDKVEGFTIYGYTGNAAEYYAKENGFEFVSLGESQNPATPDEATPDEATPDEATPDEATPDEATPDEATPDEPKGVGDANGDGVTDILDGALIQKYLVGKIEYPEEYLSWLDVNNDNAVDILDATDIQKFAAGIITEFNRRE